jgi:hypothetical protein
MEWDNEGAPTPMFSQEDHSVRRHTSKRFKQSYAETAKKAPFTKTIKNTTGNNSGHRALSRSSTELSFRGPNLGPEVSTTVLIKYVMERQENHINTLVTVQTETINDLLSKQQQTLTDSITQITNAIPSMITQILQQLIPTMTSHFKTILAQDSPDNHSDKSEDL